MKRKWLMMLVMLFGMSIAFMMGGWTSQTACHQLALATGWAVTGESLPPFAVLFATTHDSLRLPDWVLRALISPCRETLLWQEVAESPQLEAVWIYHNGQHTEVVSGTLAYTKLRVWGYRLFAEISEEGSPYCLTKSEEQTLREEERALELRLGSEAVPRAWENAIFIIPTTGPYRGWKLRRFLPGELRADERLCGYPTENEAIVEIIDAWIGEVTGAVSHN